MTQHDGPGNGREYHQQNPIEWSGRPPYAGGPLPPTPPGPAPKKGNWFARHKILTGLAGLVGVVVIATAATASGSSDPQPAAATGSTSAAADGAARTATRAAETKPAESKAPKKEAKKAEQPKAEKKDSAPGIGAAVKSGNLQFTVTKVVRNQAQVGQEYLTEKAQGRFTLVYVTVRNVGSDSETLLDDEQKIKDAADKTYSPDSMAELSIKDNDVFFEQINPGNAVDGVLVYDMPVGVTATAIDFSGGLFDDAKTVQLH